MSGPEEGRGRVMVLVLGVALGCAVEPATGVITVHRAERIHGPSEAAPPAEDPRWEPVALPDWWGMRARQQSLRGWYRASISLSTTPDEVWAVYLPRIGQHVTVWVNRALIGASGRLVDPLPRNWNRPQLFSLPAALLRPGENEVLIRLVTHIGAPGFLSALYIGPDRLLRPRYDARTWRQVTLAQIVGTITLAGGLLLLIFSARHERLRHERFLALGLVLWAWTTADAFMTSIRVPTRWWEASTSAALVWSLVCFTIGFHRVFALQRPRADRAVAALGLVYTAALFVMPARAGFALVIAGGGLAVGMACYLFAVLVRARGSARAAGRILGIPAAAGIVAGAHDLVLVTTGHGVSPMLLSPFLPVVAVAASAWLVLERHLGSLRETEALNADLEARVDQKQREAAAHYGRVRELERRHAIAGERERIMQELHDGMGGQLVSTLAMVEGEGWTGEQVSDALRAALDDLRIVIDSLDPGERDPVAALAMVRARMEPGLARCGLRFRWDVAEVPPVAGFGPESALHIMRIVQEAITNVVRHARARTITVRTGVVEDGANGPGTFVAIEDDGIGIEADATRGRGLAGMRRRAERLGGMVTVERMASEGGTCVRLFLPRRAARE